MPESIPWAALEGPKGPEVRVNIKKRDLHFIGSDLITSLVSLICYQETLIFILYAGFHALRPMNQVCGTKAS